MAPTRREIHQRRARWGRPLAAAFGAVTLAAALAGPTAAAPPLRDWAATGLGPEAPTPQAGGPVTPADLLSLRDLGGLSLSPDGRRLAFALRQGDPQSDRYVVRWFLTDTHGGDPEALAFEGGQPIRYATPAGPLDGFISLDPAQWSPDGRYLALRRQVGDRIELWRIDTRSGDSLRVADGIRQVTRFAWLAADTLAFRTGLDTDGFRASVAKEAKHGWRLDQRVLLLAAQPPVPQPPACTEATRSPFCDSRLWSVDARGEARLANAADQAAFALATNPRATLGTAIVADVGVIAMDASGRRRAWTQSLTAGDQGAAPIRRLTTDAAAKPCRDAACAGQFITALGWARNGHSIWFLKRIAAPQAPPGLALDQSALYEWRLDTGAVVRRFQHEDLLEDCHGSDTHLYCVRSSATRPRHIVAISLETGALRVLADPNPSFANKRFPEIRRLPLTDPFGATGFARLVYPLGYRPGRAYPLVVTLYRSRGLLRGSSPGDEVPILPLSAAGMFVLSVDMPDDLRAWASETEAEIGRRQRADQSGMRSLVGATEQAVDRLVAEGLVDKGRVAITGLSWGSQAVHYALQHSDHFQVGIASQGLADLTYFAQLPRGPIRDASMRMMQSETLLPTPGAPLQAAGWSQQPEKLRAPLLLNLGQNEALFGFEGLMALQAADRPLEVRVFADETHTKHHPANLSGVYDNNMMWLRFWLLGQEDPDPAFSDQYQRWRAMRAKLAAEKTPGRNAE